MLFVNNLSEFAPSYVLQIYYNRFQQQALSKIYKITSIMSTPTNPWTKKRNPDTFTNRKTIAVG